MATRKLFYEDCHLKTFTAKVLSCAETSKGFAVTLDATAFYPEGGGQACDLGILGGVRVLDVRESGEEVVHLCENALEVGSEVEAPSTGAAGSTRCSSTPVNTSFPV